MKSAFALPHIERGAFFLLLLYSCHYVALARYHHEWRDSDYEQEKQDYRRDTYDNNDLYGSLRDSNYGDSFISQLNARLQNTGYDDAALYVNKRSGLNEDPILDEIAALSDPRDDDDSNGAPADTDPEQETVELAMPGVQPTKPDTYLCVALRLSDKDKYIVKYEPRAKMQVAHHMLLFGCGEPYDKDKVWQCGEMKPVCRSGGQSIMYAWAKNAPELDMPKDVGMHIGGNSGINYAVLQVHYADVSSFKDGKTKDHSGLKITWESQKKRFLAGIYLLADGWTDIPPHKPKFHIDVGCQYPEGQPRISPFRFRTHAHKLGLVITGYRIRDRKWTLIGMGDPQRPQAFYKVFNDVDIQPGDQVVARCTMNSTSRDRVTHIGATHEDEMCNFYIMYFYDTQRQKDAPSYACRPLDMTDHSQFYTKFPKDSDTPLIEMEERKLGKLKKTKTVTKESVPDNKIPAPAVSLKIKMVHKWPVDGTTDGSLPLTVGQISGVAVNPTNEEVVIFQRATRKWDMSTFNEYNVLHTKYQKPIEENTIISLKQSDGDIVSAMGQGMFYMPHGISIDGDGNIWVTDVGAHQVIKLSPSLKPLLTLGTKFKPGNDATHFCKPTDVAILKSGDFFVADGYCNSRVVKFNAKGEVLFEITERRIKDEEGISKKTFNVVHSVAVDEKGNQLFVADRENNRVLIFDVDTGKFKEEITKVFGGAVYAVAYSPQHDGVLHVINGPSMMPDMVKGSQARSGFTYHLKSKTVIAKWKPDNGFGLIHDLAVGPKMDLYVAQINPSYRIFKFKNHK